MGPKKNYSSDVAKFRKIFDQSQRVVALTGAGISAESGVPTFRGDGGLWRQHQATDLANPETFERDPSLVWQFYEYRRQLVATKSPNNAHLVRIYVILWYLTTKMFVIDIGKTSKKSPSN